jgi:hypothetical protein
MPNYATECQPIANKITGLQSEVASLQTELQTAEPGEKAGIIGQIKSLDNQIATQQGLLTDCVKQHPYQPPPPNPCLSLLKALNTLQQSLSDAIQQAVAPLQKELQKATGAEKVAILGQI